MDESTVGKSPIDAALGERLRGLRETRRLSLAELGRAIGTSYQQVRNYEAGHNRISAATLYRLSQTLDVEINDFFKDLPTNAAIGSRVPSADEAGRWVSLEQIDNPEVRRHMLGLLDALARRD